MHVARSMHPLSDKRTKPGPPCGPPAAPYLERTEFPHCHPSPSCPLPSRLLLPRDDPFSTPAYPPPAGRCVQFADVKCNIRLSPLFVAPSSSSFSSSLPDPHPHARRFVYSLCI